MTHLLEQSQGLKNQSSVVQQVKLYLSQVKEGEPFTLSEVVNNTAHYHVKRTTVSKTLSRFVRSGLIDKVSRGIFVKPKINRFIGRVPPNLPEVIQVIAEERCEIIQTHGVEAVRQFKLSTQTPTQPIYYTSGRSRQMRIGNLMVRFVHTSDRNKLQHAGEKPGTALSALYYIGSRNVDTDTVRNIHRELNEKEFQTLCQSNMPKWMSEKLMSYYIS